MRKAVTDVDSMTGNLAWATFLRRGIFLSRTVESVTRVAVTLVSSVSQHPPQSPHLAARCQYLSLRHHCRCVQSSSRTLQDQPTFDDDARVASRRAKLLDLGLDVTRRFLWLLGRIWRRLRDVGVQLWWIEWMIV